MSDSAENTGTENEENAVPTANDNQEPKQHPEVTAAIEQVITASNALQFEPTEANYTALIEKTSSLAEMCPIAPQSLMPILQQIVGYCVTADKFDLDKAQPAIDFLTKETPEQPAQTQPLMLDALLLLTARTYDQSESPKDALTNAYKVAQALPHSDFALQSLSKSLLQQSVNSEGAVPQCAMPAIEFLIETIPTLEKQQQAAALDTLCYLTGMTYDRDNPETNYLPNVAELLSSTDIDVRNSVVHDMSQGTPDANHATHVLTVNAILLATDPDADIQRAASSTLYAIGRWYPGDKAQPELDLADVAIGSLAMAFKNASLSPHAAYLIVGEMGQFASFESDPDLRPHMKLRAPFILSMYDKILELIEDKSPEITDTGAKINFDRVREAIEEERGYIYTMHPEFAPKDEKPNVDTTSRPQHTPTAP